MRDAVICPTPCFMRAAQTSLRFSSASPRPDDSSSAGIAGTGSSYPLTAACTLHERVSCTPQKGRRRMDGTPTPPETRCCCYVQRDRCGCGTPSARGSDGCSTNRRAGRELLCRPPDQVLAHPIHLRLPPFSKKAIRASRGKYINTGR